MLNLIRHTDTGRRAVVNLLTAQVGLLVCGLFLLAGWGLAGDYREGIDYVVQRENTRVNLRYILGQADRVDTRFPHDRWYGVAFELPLLLVEGAGGLEDYYDVHRLRASVTHLFFLVGGFFCYLLAWRLFNNRLIALFALLLFLLHPRIYTHSFINTKDLPFLSMFMVALYLTERTFRKDTAGAFLLLGIAVGIATNLRIMGIMLLLAVVGMRALDAALARDWRERKGILATGGLFVAAAGLTWYALSPNAWGDPLAQLTGALSLTTSHPTVTAVLFFGEWMLSDELPAHFGLTWFVITMPPPVLLLGAVGIAIAAARGLTRPGAVWANTKRRFWWLLAGCCGLPLLGAALVGSTMYDGWRHLYFIYAPFVLLAAGGLYWAVGALPCWLRAGVYGLFGLGLGLTLLQMAQLHPLQQIYFNFLEDRIAPNHLQDSYPMQGYQLMSQWALAYALGRHPGETLAVNRPLGYPWIAQQPEERRRLTVDSPVHDPDYLWSIGLEESGNPDTAFNTLYLNRYNNGLVGLRMLEGSWMTAAMRAGYEELYRAAVAGEPIIRGEYDVYLEGRRVTFVKEDCQRGERAGWFRVKVYRNWAKTPARDIPEEPRTDFERRFSHLLKQGQRRRDTRMPGDAGRTVRPEISADSDLGSIPNLAAYSVAGNYGARVDGRCLAVIQLPEEPARHLVVGRYTAVRGGRALWETPHSFSSPSLRELAAELGANRPGTTGEAGFELYRQGKRLIYYREGCAAAERAVPIFLHITPEDAGDLHPERWEYGFEVRDFEFGRQGLWFDGRCVATVELPDYAIAELRTGQEGYWEFRGLPLVEPGVLRERAAALAEAKPDFRGEFDLFWRDGELIYRREGCMAADTAAGFFLHIRPVNGADLAAARREYGFEVRDFEFAHWGEHFDGQCAAVVPLPGYAIAGIRTGQYVPGRGEVWSAGLQPP